MFKGKRIVLVISVLLIALFVLAACQSEPTEVEVTRVVEVEVPGETVEVPGETVEVEVEVTRVVEVPAEVEMAVAVIPYEEEWANSPHNDAEAEAFRHWDEDGEVPGRCSRCHSAEGLPLFIEQGVTINQPTANGLNCATCHDDLNTYTRYQTEDVTFPSGSTVTLEDPDANLCMNCHQGRSSGSTVDARIGDTPDDEVSDSLGFINVHYFAAGASLFGSEAGGAYEFDGNDYVGRFEHVGNFDVCIECHDTHALEVKYEACGNCHEGVESEEDLHNIRISETDFDGDGDAAEGIAGEVETMNEALLVAMNAYATATEGVDAIVYDSHSYPYFFNDAEERYATWTPNLLRAAYNYQYAQKDPGGFAHNGQYILQALYDSIAAVGGDVSGMTRPG